MIIRGISWYVIIQKCSKIKRTGTKEGNTVSFCRRYDYKSGETKSMGKVQKYCKHVIKKPLEE